MSRIEQLLEALLNGSTDVPAPQSRVEALLYALIKKGGTGSGGGGVSSWNDLTDKPFGTETEEVGEFNGNLTGWEKILVNAGVYAVKVSPLYVEVGDLIGATLGVTIANSVEESIILTAETVVNASDFFGVEGSVVLMDDNPLVFSLPRGATIEGIALSSGTWVMYIDGEIYVKSLSCLQFAKETVHKIDPIFLPDGISGVLNETPIAISNIDGSAISFPSAYGTLIAQGDVYSQSQKGFGIFSFMFKNPDGGDPINAQIMLTFHHHGGPIDSMPDSTDTAFATGYYYRNGVIVLMDCFFVFATNTSTVALGMRPVYNVGGTSANPVVYGNDKFYSLGVDSTGAVIAKELP